MFCLLALIRQCSKKANLRVVARDKLLHKEVSAITGLIAFVLHGDEILLAKCAKT